MAYFYTSIWYIFRVALTQDGVLEVLEALNRYDETKKVDIFYFLKLQLRYFFLNYGRYDKKAISLNMPIGDGIELVDTLVDQSNVEDIVLADFDTKAAYKALQGLKEQDRYIIEQNIIRRRPLADLAMELNMSRTGLFRKKKEILCKMQQSFGKSSF